MSVSVKMNFNLRRFNLDLHKELNEIGRIVRRDHNNRLERGKGIQGSMRDLKPATIKAKQRSSDSRVRNNANKILVATGQMRNLEVEEATTANQEVEIHPGRIRPYKGTNVTMADVGEFHQTGAGNLPVREWFGITPDVERRAIKHIENEIERAIRRA